MSKQPIEDIEDDEVVICSNCGREAETTNNFCTYCGTKLRNYVLLCPNCWNKVSVDDNYCGICGKSLSKTPNKRSDAKRFVPANSPVVSSVYPEAVNIAETVKTPGIILDIDQGIFEFSGKSVPEDAAKFYEPILAWIDAFVQDQPLAKSVVVFRLGYFNTTTSKIILGIVQKLAKIKKEVIIRWYYSQEDEEMQEYGEVLEEITRLKFEMYPTATEDEE